MAKTQVQKTTNLTKVHKRLGERLGMKANSKVVSGASKCKYTVQVFETRFTEVVGHILKVTSDSIQIHNVRKSGSAKTDISIINTPSVVAIEGDINELGRIVVRKEDLVAEYKDVTLVETKNGFIKIKDCNGSVVVINSNADNARVTVTADADQVAASKKTAKKADKKATKKADKKPSKSKVKRRNKDDDEEEF